MSWLYNKYFKCFAFKIQEAPNVLGFKNFKLAMSGHNKRQINKIKTVPTPKKGPRVDQESIEDWRSMSAASAFDSNSDSDIAKPTPLANILPDFIDNESEADNEEDSEDEDGDTSDHQTRIPRSFAYGDLFTELDFGFLDMDWLQELQESSDDYFSESE